MSSTVSRPNFFLLLGLEPDVAWDQAAFEQVLRKKRNEWSRQSAGVAKKALVAKQNLALIPKIQEVMVDPSLRAREARSARLALAATRRKEYEQFEQQLAFLNARETVTQEEVNKFIAAFQHLLSPQEIRSRVQVRVKVPADDEIPPALDASIAKRITDLLQFLHVRTLYELLQCSPLTATSEAARSAEALYTQLVRHPPTAESTARIELAGLARDIFQSDEMRARYDTYVRQETLDHLLRELDESMERSTDADLHPKQVALFLERARRQGCSEQDALLRLKEHARQRKWIVTLPATALSGEQQVLCPNCRHANPPGQRLCSSCHFALSLDCPRCGVLVSSEAANCGQCGFAVGNRFLVDRLLDELRLALKDGDSEQASELLARAEPAWQPGTPDKRSLQIKTCHMDLQRLVLAQQRAQQEVLEGLGTIVIREANLNAQHMVRIDWWAPVSNGSVAILRSTQALEQQGKAIPLTQLDQLGTLLEDRGNYALSPWHAAELTWYTPVILLRQQAYLGRSQSYYCLEGVSNLQYQLLGSVLRLRWLWPDQCQEVLISYSTQQEFSHHDAGATTCTVSRGEYEQRGYYDLRVLASRDCFLLVSATLQLKDQRAVAEGVYLAVRLSGQMVITYTIKRATLWQRKLTLHLTIDPPGPLPALLLVYKEGRLPLRKSDGDLLHRIAPESQGRGSVQIELPLQPLPVGSFGKLFLEDETLYREWIIHHPGEHYMRLS